MDLEAMQILNLSPIPELSEIELSTMLDHLSGLSDINGDLTDRNVEDILKEAEDLLDRSTSSKTFESRSLIKSPVAEENKSLEINEEKNESENEEQIFQNSDLEDSKNDTIPVNKNSQAEISNDDLQKHFNTPVANSPTVPYSPGSSSNHIKSTIDSLKEFSVFIEKKLANKTPDSSPKHSEISKKNQNESSAKETTISNTPTDKQSINNKQASNNIKTVKTPDLGNKKNMTEPLDQSVKLLNCFERLYRNKPVRLTSKKPKVVDKLPKTVIKKKFPKDLKNSKKNNWEDKSVGKNIADDTQMYGKVIQKSSYDDVDLLKPDKMISKFYLDSQKYLLQSKTYQNDLELLQRNCLRDNFQCENVQCVQSRTDEKQMVKAVEGVEEIKDQVNKGTTENSEKVSKSIDIPKIDLDFEKETLPDSSIKRLEEQFCVLKDKYNYQIEKLEAENTRLKEALNNQQKMFTPRDSLRIGTKEESVFNIPFFRTSENKTSPITACRTPLNSPYSSPKKFQTSKEASSQTEKDTKNTSVQCSQEFKEVGTNSSLEIISEVKKTENKENLTTKQKQGKQRPFSDLNLKQKKAIEHETQLMATLRGLQAEITVRDKENRKLKSEIESLRRQMKKLGNVKVENCRRCNIGTQTIGLGSLVQKPYNPENYEVPFEFEKENEDLRSRIKALEEDFELLKEKRITDLQSLHQVHEEEMAKLVSKLETQSALTKHLHSLLVNR